MVGLLVTLTTVLLVALVFAGAKPVTTEDIGMVLDPANQRLGRASFIPGVPRDTVEEKARDSAAEVLKNTDTSDLEAKSTVGLYTGVDSRGNEVTGRRVWVVVIEDLPMTFPSGPAVSPVNRNGQRQRNQLIIIFDADTGEKIDGFISGRWVKE